jgi:predicted GNAT family acetyltransferase
MLGRLKNGRVFFLKITRATIGDEEKVLDRFVSMLSFNRVTDTTIAISNVATLPENAARGYATQLVALATRRVLDLGKTAVLFTDLSNPKSYV